MNRSEQVSGMRRARSKSDGELIMVDASTPVELYEELKPVVVVPVVEVEPVEDEE